MSERRISGDAKRHLWEALLRIQDLHVPEVRQLHIAEIQAELGRTLTVKAFDAPKFAIYALLNACADDGTAMDALFESIKTLHGDHPVIPQLERLLLELRPPLLSGPQRQSLVELLAGLDPARLRDAYRERIGSPSPDHRPLDWTDTESVLRQAELASQPQGGVPLFLAFVERTVHGIGDQRLHDLVVDWVVGVGLDASLDPVVLRSLVARTKPATPGQVRAPTSGTFGANNVSSLEIPVKYDHVASPTDAESGDNPVKSTTLITSTTALTEDRSVIWGGVPTRNPDFTGRDRKIRDLRERLVNGEKDSVVAHTLHGLGGVGKTQIAVEYVYQYAEFYDLIWWISADSPTTVRASLASLGTRLDIPPGGDMAQTVTVVLDALSTSGRNWLLVFDNADLPDDLNGLVPSTGGHVVITSRNQEWPNAVEVDVFDRVESIELLLKRGQGISEADADRLAAKLGDLPLALEQAASWQAATGMPVTRYLELFDAHVTELLQENKPPNYPATISAFLTVACEKLRTGEVPAASQLIELFAFLGPDPISAGLLRAGRGSEVSEPLREALSNEILLNRAIREIRRHGLAKVAPNGQRMQVHRLVQLVLREGLREDRKIQSKTNLQHILASANPGSPDERESSQVHAEIGPHILAADLIGAEADDARQVVLDQARYLYIIGDNAGSRDLSERMVAQWSRPAEEGGLGPDHPQTLSANRHLANALRILGIHERARRICEDTIARLQRNPAFGDRHEFTVAVALGLGADLRIAGELEGALLSDTENLARAEEVYGQNDLIPQMAKSNITANLRMLGNFKDAYTMDNELVRDRAQTLGENHPRSLWSISNLARDLYGLGRYTEALDLQRKSLSIYLGHFGPRHSEVLLAYRTIAIALRKTGQYGDALSRARENYRAYHDHFGALHEHTLAATMSYANALRVFGQLQEAQGLADKTMDNYVKVFGARHPLTLAAATNRGIILRAGGRLRDAKEVDEDTYGVMLEVLGSDHPHTLCMANSLANDLVADHNLAGARALTEATLATSQRVRGADHPYTLACAVNAALDLKATGDAEAGGRRLAETVATMRATLGPEHPETLHALQERRAECDIEPPPT